jgi:hypothetical protein
LALNDASRQFRPKAIPIFSSEHAMIADIQTQVLVVAATENQEQLVIVQDIDLVYVGGGTGLGCSF